MMKENWYLLIPILLFLLLPKAHSASLEGDSTRVLFIGNSYTYYHSMPQLFKAMVEYRFPDHQIETKFVGHGGATLKQHWEEGRALHEIQSGRWDYVVLQEQSMLGEEIFENGRSYVRSPDQFVKYGRKFELAIRKSGAETVFYMTWSRKDRPDQQKYLTYAYMSIAKETGSLIAPVGMAWESLQKNPQFELYDMDGSHPSVYGAYTAALTIFTVLSETDPAGIPGRLEEYEILRGGKLSDTERVLCNVPDHDVKRIQNTVWTIFQRMKTNDGYLNVEKAISDKKPSQFSQIFNYVSDARGQFVLLMVIIGAGFALKGCIFLLRK